MGLQTANKILGAEADHVKPRPIAITMPHSKIDILSCEVDVMHCCGNPEINVGVRLGKPAKAIYQPLGGEIGRRADRQDARTLALNKALRANGNPVERISQDDKVVATGLGNDQSLALAIEELDTEFCLQGFDLMTYCSLGDAQFLGGSGETFVPRRSLKNLERV